jgi:hypothetical protein
MSNDWGAIWPLLLFAGGGLVVSGSVAFWRERPRGLRFWLALAAVAAVGGVAVLVGGRAGTVILILLLLLGLMFGSLLILVGNVATSLASFP